MVFLAICAAVYGSFTSGLGTTTTPLAGAGFLVLTSARRQTENGPSSGSPDRAIPRTFVEIFEIAVNTKRPAPMRNDAEFL
jgi:hypothetical protein